MTTIEEEHVTVGVALDVLLIDVVEEELPLGVGTLLLLVDTMLLEDIVADGAFELGVLEELEDVECVLLLVLLELVVLAVVFAEVDVAFAVVLVTLLLLVLLAEDVLVVEAAAKPRQVHTDETQVL